MIKNIFKNYLKTATKSATKRQLNNIQRANKALLVRIAKCFDTFIRYNVGVDYYVPIYGDKFNIDNKIRHKTLQILKDENIIQVKTNKNGKESYQCSFTKNIRRMDVDNPTPKSYSFTSYGWSLVQNKRFLNQIKQLITKENKPTKCTDILTKAANDNLSLRFILDKPIPAVVEEYLEAVKDQWNITQKNYKYKYKEAEKLVFNTINNFNNKLIKFDYRMYSALSLCPKELRKYVVTPTNEHIKEVFDINSSIYTLLGLTLQLYMIQNNISIPAQFYKEQTKLEQLCFNEEHIYSTIGRWNGGHYSKAQIKPHNMQVIFSNNEDIQSMDARKGPRNQIKNFIKAEFPTIWSILAQFKQELNEQYDQQLQQYNQFIDQISMYNAGLIQYKPQHINKPKQIKSSIWRYFQRIETHIMLTLKQHLEAKLNTTLYWVHDCFNSTTSIESTIIKEQFQQLLIATRIELEQNKNVSSIIWGRRETIKEKEIKNERKIYGNN